MSRDNGAIQQTHDVETTSRRHRIVVDTTLFKAVCLRGTTLTKKNKNVASDVSTASELHSLLKNIIQNLNEKYRTTTQNGNGLVQLIKVGNSIRLNMDQGSLPQHYCHCVSGIARFQSSIVW